MISIDTIFIYLLVVLELIIVYFYLLLYHYIIILDTKLKMIKNIEIIYYILYCILF